MFRSLSAFALVTLLGVCSCARDPIQRGTNLYADGHFIEAAEVFERTEDRIPDMSARDQARYGLYRGLTLLVLGDLRGAHHWFSYARNVERRYPGALGEQRVALLERGSYELGTRIQQTPAPPGVSTALAATPPVTPAPTPPVGVTPEQRGSETTDQRSLVP